MPATDCFDMDPIAAVTANSLAGAEAIEATSPTPAGGSAQTQAQKLGLPPAGLAAPTATNTINAQLVSSQWGIDQAAVSGVYGGAAASGGGLFSGDALLAVLRTLPAANAEQALALLGIQTSSPSSSSVAAATAKPAAKDTVAAAAYNATSATAASSGGSDVGTTVDPLWGVRA